MCENSERTVLGGEDRTKLLLLKDHYVTLSTLKYQLQVHGVCLSHFDSYLLFLHSFYTFLHNAALNTCWRPTESKFLNQNVDIEQLRVAFPWPAASEPTITPQIIILSVTRVIFFFLLQNKYFWCLKYTLLITLLPSPTHSLDSNGHWIFIIQGPVI